MFYKLCSPLLKCLIAFVMCLSSISAYSQTEQRLRFSSVTPSEDTGQDYSSWMSDNLDSLVANAWQYNFKYVDVTLKLKSPAKITRLSFYDFEGVFTDKPAEIYALKGTAKTFLGYFKGETYKTFIALQLASPVEADAILIHKYSNNIPQKIFAYGYPDVITAPPITDTAIVKIPVNEKRWYQLNNATDGLGGLFDGITTERVGTGWGKMFNNYDAYYPVADGEGISISKVRFFDGEGSLGEYPLTLSAITKDGRKIKLGTFTGDRYNGWVGPYPERNIHDDSQFKLDTPVNNIKYLVLNCWYQFPTEIELYGTYKPGKAIPPLVKRPVKLKQFFGVNAFEWDFLSPYDPFRIDETRMKPIKAFTQVRHYIDWQKLESMPGSYTFNPVHSGGWNYDAIYERCKAEGIDILACIKTIPDWMLATYPADQHDPENVPVRFGKDFSDPKSYIEQAKVAFQYAARYGSNQTIDTTLLSVNERPRWTNDPTNSVKKGLGLIKYIECDNERDKWWKGRKAYQTAYEYAANLSAFYDGHKNTMGPGVGVKNADPEIKVVMGGLALPSTDYVRAMVDWCIQHRGYRPDGTVNLCWDVINYHLYSNDAKTSQGGYSTRGAAPEVSEAAQVAHEFLQVAHEYANDMPVWVTELGYDANQGSPLRAIPIGDKNEYQTQADWILRSSLMYARTGVERIFFYQLYDDNFLNPTQFGSSGLINTNKTRKPAADYLMQANKLLGEYTYKETIHNDPLIDRYEHDGQSAYVLLVPDEKGRTADYSLDLPGADSVKIYTPTIGRDSMSMQKQKITDKLEIKVTETPVFIIPVYANKTYKPATMLMSVAGAGSSSAAALTPAEMKVYPNPTSDYLTINLDSKYNGYVQVLVTNINSGVPSQKYQFQKFNERFAEKIDLAALPYGVYLVTVKQGDKTDVKRVTKL
jgi:endoglucanase